MKRFFVLFFALGGLVMTNDAASATKLETATFAGGCFWCMETPFEKIPGVKEVVSGYTGGRTENPTYEQICTGTTGHAEAVQVTFDPAKVSYDRLLDAFWRNIDPTTKDAQFADRGTQYRTAIFTHSDEQRKAAEASKDRLAKSGKFMGRPIVTEITPASTFYRAEEYHQNYCRKNPVRYNAYRIGSGRAGFLERLWGKEEK